MVDLCLAPSEVLGATTVEMRACGVLADLVDSIQTALAVARAELRTARRLARTWVFAILAIVITLALFGFYALLEAQYSTVVPGRFGTRFEAGNLGVYLLGVGLVGLILLALDVRARDEGASMAEAIDSRPFTNLALVVGQVAGLALTAWLPVVAALLLVQTFGAIARTFAWWMGDTIEPYSLAALAVLDAIPVLILWSSVLLLLVVVLRNRLVAALTASFVIGGVIWSIPGVPVYLLEALVPVSNYDTFASDLAPRLASAEVLVQRGSILFLAAGLVIFAAVWHPREDGSPRRLLVPVGVACVVLGSVGIGVLVLHAADGMQQREDWLAVHTIAAQKEAHVRADVTRLGGSVVITPGRNLEVGLTIALEAPRELEALVFSFNPAMRISSLRLGGVETPFEHEDGLLTVGLLEPMASGATNTLSIHAAGVPDPRFAHLDSAVDPWLVPARNAISTLGREAAIFHRDYVGLMPATHWLPASGANVHRDDAARRARDFFVVDLRVEVPKGWLAASVGRRQVVDDRTFRFASGVPVAEVGLFVSRFARRAIEVDGIEVELLAHPDHFRGFRMFDGVEGALTNHLEEIHEDLANLGLGYPFGSLSMVEVPARLRGFRGGWPLDGEPALPGVLPIRENGLPMVRPAYRYLAGEGQLAGQVDAEQKLSWLRNISRNLDSMALDSGIMAGFVRNLLSATGASGDGAVALDWVLGNLAYALIEEPIHYLDSLKSAHNLNAEEGRSEALAAMLGYVFFDDRQSLFERGSPFVDRAEVWEHALGKALSNLEPERSPAAAARSMGLKGKRVVDALRDDLGRRGAAALLAALRERYAGRTYQWADLVTVGESVGAPVDALLGDWLHAGPTAGFLVSTARVSRLADDDAARPRYQASVWVRNDEAVPGAVFLGTDRQVWGERTDPVRIGARSSVELSMVSREPPSQLWLHSYFSLNRTPVRLEVLGDVDDDHGTADSFVGVRPSDWAPRAEGVVVDDLDAGFSVEADRNVASGGPWGLDRSDLEVDQGLPRYWWFLEDRLGGAWSREPVYSAWGKYRRTMVRAVPGSGRRRAVFTAELPTAGTWRLEFHIPGDPVPQLPGGDYVPPPYPHLLGRYDMWLRSAQGSTAIEFDGSSAIGGWNGLGEFDVESRHVSVVVSNRTDGDVVIADAIRWLEVTE